jgi:hypothetical protein
MFITLVIQHGIRMRNIMFTAVACLALLKLSLLSQMRYNFFGGGGMIEHKMCFDFLYKHCLKYFLI